MTSIISAGVLMILACCLILVALNAKKRFSGDQPASSLAFVAILFTSGLDGGFILLPLLEFATYQADESYHFSNPLAIEVGFWGLTVWLLYFVSTLYFCAVEPKLKFFDRRWVKLIHSIVVLLTAAFTLSLFAQCVAHFLSPLVGDNTVSMWTNGLVLLMILSAIGFSSRVKLMTRLSQVSVVLFVALVGVMLYSSQFDIVAFQKSGVLVTEYFEQLPTFILPFNDYHEFYIAWWLSWTFMLGQFVSRFVNNMTLWQLLLSMIVLPLLPTFIWFSVLFHWYEQSISLSSGLNVLFILVAVLFVVNSLDFMAANYSRSLGLNIERFANNRRGKLTYVALNTGVLLAVTLLFQTKLMLVNYIAVLVIGLVVIIAAIYCQKGLRELANMRYKAEKYASDLEHR